LIGAILSADAYAVVIAFGARQLSNDWRKLPPKKQGGAR
jgi:hypothetical protein